MKALFGFTSKLESSASKEDTVLTAFRPLDANANAQVDNQDMKINDDNDAEIHHIFPKTQQAAPEVTGQVDLEPELAEQKELPFPHLESAQPLLSASDREDKDSILVQGTLVHTTSDTESDNESTDLDSEARETNKSVLNNVALSTQFLENNKQYKEESESERRSKSEGAVDGDEIESISPPPKQLSTESRDALECGSGPEDIMLADEPSSGSPATGESPQEPGGGEEQGSSMNNISPQKTAVGEKTFQLPAFFSGLRVRKKGQTAEERETITEIKQQDSDLALLKLRQPVKKANITSDLFAKKKSAEPKTNPNILEQLSHLFKIDGTKNEDTAEDSGEASSETEDSEGGPESKSSSKEPQSPSEETKLGPAESALDVFKALFMRPPKKETTADTSELEAIKQKMRHEKESLKAVFERSKSKPGDGTSEQKSPDLSPSEQDDKTPGRLQTVWPPPKINDQEEKVGLKYTEAEYQAAILHLKREHKEEIENLKSQSELRVFHIRGEHALSTAKLEEAIENLKNELENKLNKGSEKAKDVCVSTEDENPPKTYRNGPRKPTIEPSCPMKPLYWTRIQIQNRSKTSTPTLWDSLEEPDILDTSEFEYLFSKDTAQEKRKPLSESYEKKSKAKKIIKLMDGKRSQTVGILISSLHLEMKDIQQAILNVDDSVVDQETLEALYENRAQKDELEKIKQHYETSKKEELKLLDKPEQFLYELSQIPNFAERAQCIIFQSVFSEGITSVHRKVDIITCTSKALLSLKSVKEILGLILAFGNYMNGGNRTRGQADGFGLEILPKLKDVKSRDNEINLVDYVVIYYLRHCDKEAGTDKSIFPLPEPQDFFQASQVKFEDLIKDLRKLKRDLEACEKQMRVVCRESSEQHLQPFKDKLEEFFQKAREEHKKEENCLENAKKCFEETVGYFGIKPKSGEKEITPNYVFTVWYEFCSDFKIIWKRESKNISKERIKMAQQTVNKLTAEKKVETKKINPTASLKERLRQKEANVTTN
ncbi:formin-1 isoform C [Alligator mississippiensis]|uniref:Formin-1 isoform C n=1 Tax=Alligator mississippiensis TaxID=8496 RepID=A0A151MV38_ALLMI|nr:formin-1 isoform C [Alligator mississippiensis]